MQSVSVRHHPESPRGRVPFVRPAPLDPVRWVFRVPLAGLAAANHMPLVWLWTALVFDHIARMALLAFEFRRGGWKRRAMKKAAGAAAG